MSFVFRDVFGVFRDNEAEFVLIVDLAGRWMQFDIGEWSGDAVLRFVEDDWILWKLEL